MGWEADGWVGGQQCGTACDSVRQQERATGVYAGASARAVLCVPAWHAARMPPSTCCSRPSLALALIPPPAPPPPAGAHTRSIMVATPSAASGGIMKFAQKRLTCLGCKAPLGKGEQTVCKHCKAKVGGGGEGLAGRRVLGRAMSGGR